MSRLAASLRREESGAALITVLLLMFIMTGLVTVSIRYTVTAQDRSLVEDDSLGALAAAQAGVDDYLYRLNQDSNYWFLPDPSNLAFTQWVRLPGTPLDAWFRYEVDISDVMDNKVIRVTAHGAVGEEVRTINVALRRDSFLDFLYLTEYETMDPITYPEDQVTTAEHYCSHHRYETWTSDQDGQTRTGRVTGCRDIFWYGQGSRIDVVDGPFHTNDTIAVNGDPVWLDEASTSLPPNLTPRWAGSGDPEFRLYDDNNPVYEVPRTFPPTNNAIRAEADQTLGGDGCLYTGPTRLRFLSDGRLRVVSPFTASTGTGCATDGIMDVRDNMVIYVQNVPAESGDPNFLPGCPSGGHPFRYNAPDQSDRLFVRYDVSGDSAAYSRSTLDAAGITKFYNCVAGDAFVHGTLDGRVTIAAENNVTIVDDLVLAGGTGPDSDDLLGLIANNFVEIYHPWGCPGGDCPAENLRRGRSGGVDNGLPNTVWQNVRVDAAILSVQHSFILQNYHRGAPLGELVVTGAIAQLYRGPVGTFNGTTGAAVSGYQKVYVYDDRLGYLSPPHYLDPVDAGWGRLTFAELPPGHPPP